MRSSLVDPDDLVPLAYPSPGHGHDAVFAGLAGAHRLPIVLGRDLAGTLETVPDGQSDWNVGDRMCAFVDQEGGAKAEYVLVPAAHLARIPVAVLTEDAGAIPAAAVTAWQGLFDYGKLERGQSVLIHGGAGGVGHSAVQLARWRGCKVFVTASAKGLGFGPVRKPGRLAEMSAFGMRLEVQQA